MTLFSLIVVGGGGGSKFGNSLLALLVRLQVVSCMSPYQVEGDNDGEEAEGGTQYQAEVVECPAVP